MKDQELMVVGPEQQWSDKMGKPQEAQILDASGFWPGLPNISTMAQEILSQEHYLFIQLGKY